MEFCVHTKKYRKSAPHSILICSHIAMHSSTVILSIKPQYIEQIIGGQKTVELRRRFPSALGRAHLLLYSSAPVQAIVGHAVLEEVISLSLGSLWRRFSNAAAVTREHFDQYFHGIESGYALKLAKVTPLPEPISRVELVRRFRFCAPQSYCYWRRPLSALSVHGWL
jgi:predicted transcriptional regulator